MRMRLKPFICIALFIPLLAYGEKVVKEDALDSYSLFILGLNYIYGNDSLGISMDKEKGIALVRRSAEQGQADSSVYRKLLLLSRKWCLTGLCTGGLLVA